MTQEEIKEALNKMASAIWDIAQFHVGYMPMDVLKDIAINMEKIMNDIT